MVDRRSNDGGWPTTAALVANELLLVCLTTCTCSNTSRGRLSSLLRTSGYLVGQCLYTPGSLELDRQRLRSTATVNLLLNKYIDKLNNITLHTMKKQSLKSRLHIVYYN